MDTGTGFPIVLVPGIQGRWEWMRPAVRALAATNRVLTFSLGEAGDDFEAWMKRIDTVLDEARVARAAVVGVSFGGLIALRYAASRPGRVAALVLVSTPSPTFRPERATTLLLRHPILLLPVFWVRALVRLGPETVSACDGWRARLGLGLAYFGRAVRFPLSPARMAGWVQRWRATDLAHDADRVRAPTLVISGEPRLDRVVAVADTAAYAERIPGARHTQLERYRSHRPDLATGIVRAARLDLRGLHGAGRRRLEPATRRFR